MAEPLHTPKIVEKPWGREIWFADQPAYAGKLLEVRQGCRLSLQYHERKIETLYLLSGRVRLTYRATSPGAVPSTVAVTPADQFEWLPGRALHVPPRTVHRFEALEDSVLAEVSTPELTDIVRLQDDFSRPARD
jgi:quercetin dioxygenase-like cupin family protein